MSIQRGDTVAYTDAHFRRAFGVLMGCRSRDWAQGRVIDTQTIDGVLLARVLWARTEHPLQWLRASILERIA